MRILTLLVSLTAVSTAFSQLFTLSDSLYTFQKNTSQSPIHWYVEINNLSGVDTTLRWKANFSHIPAEWVVNFDTQTLNTTPVQHLDSADFTLLGSSNPPQKLIIGVDLQNKVANGNIYFNLYNPATYSDSSVLTFAFQITADLEDILESEDYTIQDGKLTLLNKELKIEAINILGQKLALPAESSNVFLLPKGEFFLYFRKNGKSTIIHVLNPKS
ncbi:MAG: hypothetical protein N4A41_05830 [Crocinitomicaceae bacterium]|jgi:hypothetical protein|nr:hypothetical protein [Crocinitomicaceae bacterium]